MKTIRGFRVGACVLLVAIVLSGRASPIVLVPANASWKFNADGIDLGAQWRGNGFNDSAWPSGAAQLGYGDGDETTVISFGPDSASKFVTTYFRRAIFAPNGMIGATLRLLRDDGAVVYINGVEVRRDNMPGGEVTFKTLATAAVGDPEEMAFFETTLPASAFVAGTNVIAVEVHQSNVASSDLSFALELIGNFSSPGPLITAAAIDSEAREIFKGGRE